MNARRSAVGAGCALLLLAGCTVASGATSSPAPGSSPPPTSTAIARLSRVACSIPHKELVRIWLGTRPDRGGQITLLPQFPNFVSGGISHAGPWPYLQRVPVLFYGPGFVPAAGPVSHPITSTDIAPSTAELLGFDFPAPDGVALPQVVPPGGETRLPKLVVTVVWDAGGLDVLNAWPHEWPYLRSLIPKGVWFSNATVGSSPSNTPPIHATIGTGAYPIHSGVLDEFIRVNGKIQKPQEDGPAFMLTPTLSDLYDRAMHNAPLVGGIATLSAHLGMLSHGSMWGGGDRDIAVTREHLNAATGGAEGDVWNLTPGMAPFFKFPSYVNSVPGFQEAVRTVDASDGAIDDAWLGNSMERLANGFDTPARSLYERKVVEAVIDREGFGRDRVPDLLYINYKTIDTVGHAFTINSPEMQSAVRFEDQNLRDFVGFLNRKVGRRQWAMVLTADHGHQYSPGVSGAFEIDVDHMQRDLEQAFDPAGGPQLIEKIRPTQIWLDERELKRGGHTLADVADFVSGLTKAQTTKPSVVPPPGQGSERVFQAAFPISILPHLPCLPEARQG